MANVSTKVEIYQGQYGTVMEEVNGFLSNIGLDNIIKTDIKTIFTPSEMNIITTTVFIHYKE